MALSLCSGDARSSKASRPTTGRPARLSVGPRTLHGDRQRSLQRPGTFFSVLKLCLTLTSSLSLWEHGYPEDTDCSQTCSALQEARTRMKLLSAWLSSQEQLHPHVYVCGKAAACVSAPVSCLSFPLSWANVPHCEPCVRASHTSVRFSKLAPVVAAIGCCAGSHSIGTCFPRSCSWLCRLSAFQSVPPLFDVLESCGF